MPQLRLDARRYCKSWNTWVYDIIFKNKVGGNQSTFTIPSLVYLHLLQGKYMQMALLHKYGMTTVVKKFRIFLLI